MPSPYDPWRLRGPDDEACRAPGCGAPGHGRRFCLEHREEALWERADLAYAAARE